MWQVTEKAQQAIYEMNHARRAFMVEMEERLEEMGFDTRQITRFSVALIYLNDCAVSMLERKYNEETLLDFTMLTYYMDEEFRSMVRAIKDEMIEEADKKEVEEE